MKLSIIIPAYNEEENLLTLHKKIEKSLSEISYETIYINDGSTDNSEEILKKIYEEDMEHVKVINFSRNFGKEAAIYAGLLKSVGEYTSIIDSDLQQNPKYLLEMINYLDNNNEYDQVAMYMKKRKEPFFKKVFSNIFYKTINILSNLSFTDGASDFRMFRSNVKNAILSMQEKNRFSKGIFSWIGFNTKYLPYEVEERLKGKSKFTFKKSISYALDGIIGYSVKPLKIATLIGVITSLLGFIYLLYIIISTFIYGIDTPGFATITCLILFIGGMQLTCLGIIGEYISKMFIEVKSRPIFVTKSEIGFDDEIL